jgi:hypothetical protein
MPGKRIRQWVVVTVAVGLTGCCHWCERHCGQQPAATCCQPQVVYPAQQAVYQAQPAYAAPGCYPAPAAYPAPAGYQPSYSQWQRPVAASNGCCE